LLLLLSAALGGCALAPTGPVPEPTPQQACTALFRELDREVAAAGVQDQGPVQVAGFPFLRANRFLASYREELAGDRQFAAWVGHLARLDAEARTLELRNMGQGRVGSAAGFSGEQLDSCRETLVQTLLADPRQRAALLQAAEVPDDYVTAWRILGLYPLTAPFVSLGVRRGQEETREVFARPLDALTVEGQLKRWQGTAGTDAPNPLPQSDPLGIPLLTPAEKASLFRRHAPVWEVDTADHDDLPGAPVWGDDPGVDTGRPAEYRLLSYTRLGDEVLVQLNYMIWFRARPGDDIYAGRIDGLIWRVTLGPDGEPWLYDSIHSCGCYHMFFPTRHLRLREDLPSWNVEPPLLPQQAPPPPLVLRVASGTHYLQRVYTVDDLAAGEQPGPQQAPGELVVEDYSQLRSLPAEDGYRSYFGAHGLVPGSERGERFILWPMGVRSPGAMRQWGHHAVAFVGRRQFDDAHLLDKLFRRAE